MAHRRKNKGSAMARTRPGGARIAGVVMIITAMCLAGGCGSSRDEPEAADIAVKVKLTRGVEVSFWWLDATCDGIFSTDRSTTTRPGGDSAEKTLTLVIQPGELLRVAVRDSGKESGALSFPYRRDGAEERPLVFSRSGFRGMANGKTVHLDLTTPKAVAWLEAQPASATKTVRSISLGDNSSNNTQALSHFAGSGLIVSFPKKMDFKPAKQSAMIRALIAAKPSGLFAVDGENIEESLADLPDLEYLSLGGKRIPNLAPLRKLKFFGFKFDEAAPGSLEPLAGATGLQSLSLLKCQATTDFKPIARHGDLRQLCLTTRKMQDLSILSNLKKLRRLVVSSEGMKDISGVRDLKSLRHAAFLSLPDAIKDLTPLESLKGLEILIVDKSALDKRKVEFDRIRRALPDTEIVGFCMGSAWIFIPILAAGLALLRHKRRPEASCRP